MSVLIYFVLACCWARFVWWGLDRLLGPLLEQRELLGYEKGRYAAEKECREKHGWRS